MVADLKQIRTWQKLLDQQLSMEPVSVLQAAAAMNGQAYDIHSEAGELRDPNLPAGFKTHIVWGGVAIAHHWADHLAQSQRQGVCKALAYLAVMGHPLPPELTAILNPMTHTPEVQLQPQANSTAAKEEIGHIASAIQRASDKAACIQRPPPSQQKGHTTTKQKIYKAVAANSSKGQSQKTPGPDMDLQTLYAFDAWRQVLAGTQRSAKLLTSAAKLSGHSFTYDCTQTRTASPWVARIRYQGVGADIADHIFKLSGTAEHKKVAMHAAAEQVLAYLASGGHVKLPEKMMDLQQQVHQLCGVGTSQQGGEGCAAGSGGGTLHHDTPQMMPQQQGDASREDAVAGTCAAPQTNGAPLPQVKSAVSAEATPSAANQQIPHPAGEAPASIKLGSPQAAAATSVKPAAGTQTCSNPSAPSYSHVTATARQAGQPPLPSQLSMPTWLAEEAVAAVPQQHSTASSAGTLPLTARSSGTSLHNMQSATAPAGVAPKPSEAAKTTFRLQAVDVPAVQLRCSEVQSAGGHDHDAVARHKRSPAVSADAAVQQPPRKQQRLQPSHHVPQADVACDPVQQHLLVQHDDHHLPSQLVLDHAAPNAGSEGSVGAGNSAPVAAPAVAAPAATGNIGSHHHAAASCSSGGPQMPANHLEVPSSGAFGDSTDGRQVTTAAAATVSMHGIAFDDGAAAEQGAAGRPCNGEAAGANGPQVMAGHASSTGSMVDHEDQPLLVRMMRLRQASMTMAARKNVTPAAAVPVPHHGSVAAADHSQAQYVSIVRQRIWAAVTQQHSISQQQEVPEAPACNMPPQQTSSHHNTAPASGLGCETHGAGFAEGNVKSDVQQHHVPHPVPAQVVKVQSQAIPKAQPVSPLQHNTKQSAKKLALEQVLRGFVSRMPSRMEHPQGCTDSRQQPQAAGQYVVVGNDQANTEVPDNQQHDIAPSATHALPLWAALSHAAATRAAVLKAELVPNPNRSLVAASAASPQPGMACGPPAASSPNTTSTSQVAADWVRSDQDEDVAVVSDDDVIILQPVSTQPAERSSCAATATAPQQAASTSTIFPQHGSTSQTTKDYCTASTSGYAQPATDVAAGSSLKPSQHQVSNRSTAAAAGGTPAMGFTADQLNTLKAQIMAFRKLKRGEDVLPPEIVDNIQPTPAFTAAVQQPPPPAAADICRHCAPHATLSAPADSSMPPKATADSCVGRMHGDAVPVVELLREPDWTSGKQELEAAEWEVRRAEIERQNREAQAAKQELKRKREQEAAVQVSAGSRSVVCDSSALNSVQCTQLGSVGWC